MRSEILFYLNGRRTTVSGPEAFLTLSDYLRESARKIGTKIVCEEGDCGACTVLIGRPEAGSIAYRAVNSCIFFVHQADSCHVITVEGLKSDGRLHPVQDALVQAHGTQCGFCTPGFAVALAAFFHNRRSDSAHNGHAVTHQDLRNAVTGNLCRCTGYESIIRAGLAVEDGSGVNLDELYPPGPIASDLMSAASTPARIIDGERQIDLPVTAAGAADAKARGSVVISGATDIGVQHNKRAYAPAQLVGLARIPELSEITVSDGTIRAGAAVALSVLESVVQKHIPELHNILWLFGAPQIRNAGTIGGNIVNASPIADTVPFLFVVNAELETAGPRGIRRIPIRSFYRGYKEFDLAADEILLRVLIPLPAPGEKLRLYKVSRRRHLDISSFSLALRLRLQGDMIQEAHVAAGGAAPTVIRLPATEAALQGRRLTEDTFTDAGRQARGEIRPISDVRGSDEYRRTLAENLVRRAYFDLAGLEVLK